jgi:SET domain-containing protein
MSEPSVRVRRSGIEGRGVVAARDIPARRLLEDLTRPLVRYSRVPQPGERGYGHAIQVSRGWWLLLDGSPFYYLNHSCTPNTRVRFAGTRVTLWSAARIRRGEELTLDYATVAFRDDPYEFACRCGATRCRRLVKGKRTRGKKSTMSPRG